MKRKIFFGLAIVAIAAMAAWNVNVIVNSQTKGLSAYSKAEVEALAKDEGGGGDTFEYNIHEGDCSITLGGSVQLSYTLFGITTTIPAGATVTLTFYDVKIYCSTGGNFQCHTYTCADFWHGNLITHD